MSKQVVAPPCLACAALAAAVVSALWAPNNVAQAQSVNGRLGDPSSWRSDEFNAQWGLGAIGAEYAYARGLTGRGVRVGISDSGTALMHSEFDGKDNRGISLFAPDADGNPCRDARLVSGPGACFRTEGDQPQLQYSQLADDVSPDDREALARRNIPGIGYEWHGTHVAGIVAANRDGNQLHGVAFGASLSTASRAPDVIREYRCADGDECAKSLSTVEEDEPETVPMLYGQLRAQGARILNNSWGEGGDPRSADGLLAFFADPENSSLLDLYAGEAIRNGLLQVFSAGNFNADVDNDGIDEITSPKAAPVSGLFASLPVARPQAEPYWLSVISVGRDQALSNFSMRCGLAARWCIAAPGAGIQSTAIANNGNLSGSLRRNDNGSLTLVTRDTGTPLYGYIASDGTSQAAPHVSGALALLQQRYPYLDITQVRDVLLTTATDLGAPGVDDVYGWGLVNLRKAIDGPGQLLVINGQRDREVVLDRPAGGARTWDGPAWDDWKNDIGGEGRLVKSGPGWLRLSGNNTFGGLQVRAGTLELAGRNDYASQVDGGLLVVGPQGRLAGATRVQGGRLQVDGTLASAQLAVAAAGTLSGTGRIEGDVAVHGAVAPGNSIGTLNIQGNYLQAAGSRYVAEVDSSGAADRLQVSGNAKLQGGTLAVQAAQGRYRLGQRFGILQAQGGVSGQFERVEQNVLNSPLLAFAVSYGTNQADLDVVRGRTLASFARTRNEQAAAAAADALPIGQGIPVPLTQLQPGPALAALRQLGGEGHPGLRTIALDETRHVREAALNRARAGRGAFPEPGQDAGHGAWAQVLRSSGTLASDGNAGRSSYSGNAALAGYDYRFDNGWRLGALLGNSRAYANNTLRDRGRVRSSQLGLYAGQQWGAFDLSAGYVFADQNYRLGRQIAFDGFSDKTSARYDGRTQQAFLEGAYRFSAGAWELQPFAQYARIRAQTDAFQERSGPAALTGRQGRQDIGAATAGLRFSVALQGEHQAEPWLRLNGSVARRYATGDLTPVTALAWRGGADYTLAGVPLAKQSMVYEAGLAARLTPHSLLEFNYSKQSGEGVSNQGLFARYSVAF